MASTSDRPFRDLPPLGEPPAEASGAVVDAWVVADRAPGRPLSADLIPQAMAISEDAVEAEAVEVTTIEAEAVDEVALPAEIVAGSLPGPKSWPFKVWRFGCAVLTWLFGLVSVLGCLAVIAAIPLLQFVSLGYLLEASGRVSRSGRLRDGFIDFPKFARIGSLVVGTWIVLLPIRFLASLAYDAAMIDPDPHSPVPRLWRLGLIAATTVAVGHILLAWYSGARLRHFFWPLLAPFQLAAHLLVGRLIGPLVLRPVVAAVWPAFADDLFAIRPLTDWFPPAIAWKGVWSGRMYREARDAVWDFVVGLRLPYYFWLGLRGFAGALAWLFIPVLMLIVGTSNPQGGAVLVGWLGALLLAFVLLYLPFLQANFAAQNRLAALFEWLEVRRQFRRAPIAFWCALLVTCLFALPLYLLKIEATPREVTWLPALVFVIFIYPARLLSGWALGRALHREQPRMFLFRWGGRLAAVPVVLFYVLVVFFTQYTSWNGPVSLFEHHAFLLPAPFFGL